MLSVFFDLLFPPRESERLVRSLSKDGLMKFLDPKVHTLSGYAVVTLLRYTEPAVRACIVETKFHNNEQAAESLGNALALYLQEEIADRNAYEQRAYALVPVPLSSARLRERGYNQAEVIARHAIQVIPELKVETGLVVRVRETLPQTTLDGNARRGNVRAAFGAARAPDPYITYIIIDDVVTTGATISEVIEVLHNAGAENVLALALAH